ncbi:hypothetical protein P7C71_g3263, partial [Lecanoromycetidae sp. Uapishka_2]
MWDPALVQILLEAGVDVNETDRWCETALQTSVSKQGVDMAQILIAAGADLNAPAEDIVEKALEDSAFRRGNLWHLITPIQRASKYGNTELVKILLSEGANVNAYPLKAYVNEISLDDEEWNFELDDTWTALQAAVVQERAVLVQTLLEAEADVGAQGLGDTPLQLAAAQGNANIVQLLLNHGADVNAPAKAQFGNTALQAAAGTANSRLVQQLLDAGAAVNASPSPFGGRTALQAAAEKGRVEVAEILIHAGADVNAEPSPTRGRTCLQAAAEGGHEELVLLLLSNGATVSAAGAAESGGLTATQAALTLFHTGLEVDSPGTESDEASRVTTILQALLDAREEVNAPSSKCKDFSTMSATLPSLLIRTLLQLDVDQKCLHAKGYLDGRTAIGEAVAWQSEEMISVLIGAGADINIYYDDGTYPRRPRTALGMAALHGNISIARLLMDAGADINTPSDRPFARTVLQYAVEGHCTALVQLLLAKGADPNGRAATHPCSKTAFVEALTTSPIDVDMVTALIEAGVDVNNISYPKYLFNFDLDGVIIPLIRMAWQGSVEIVRLFLEAGANVNLRLDNSATALQLAVDRRDNALIQIFIDAGADINASAGWIRGRTALQRAAEAGDIRIVKFLLGHGADVNAPAGHAAGITALQGAVLCGNIKIVLILLKAGACINAPGAIEDGRTALEAAAEHGRLDIVHLLLKNDDEPEGKVDRCRRAAAFAESEGHRVIARILREHGAGQDCLG